MMTILLLTLSLLGFGISSYIFFTKKRGEKLVCVIGDDCGKVLNSTYNKIFGFPAEILGMAYYVCIVISTLFFPSLKPFFFVASGIAACVAAYLLYIQAFVLKEWCEYCISAAGISIIIFGILLFS